MWFNEENATKGGYSWKVLKVQKVRHRSIRPKTFWQKRIKDKLGWAVSSSAIRLWFNRVSIVVGLEKKKVILLNSVFNVDLVNSITQSHWATWTNSWLWLKTVFNGHKVNWVKVPNHFWVFDMNLINFVFEVYAELLLFDTFLSGWNIWEIFETLK